MTIVTPIEFKSDPTVAELIALLRVMPQNSVVCVEDFSPQAAGTWPMKSIFLQYLDGFKNEVVVFSLGSAP